MKTYLVTGGAGFIGGHLVEALVRRDARVRVFDNLSTGSRSNLTAVGGDVEFLEGDIRDLDAVRRAMAGVDVVLHQAAVPSVQRSLDDPLTTNAVNVDGTLNVLVAARDAGVQRVVAASSSSVYGDTAVLPKVETMAADPRSPYAVSKLAAERYCRAFTIGYGLPTVALRYFNVFGPRQDPESHYAAVIPRFIAAMLQEESPVLYGDGQQSRDFTYIENVIHANLLAADAPTDVSGIYNVATGTRITLLDVVAQLGDLLAVQIPVQHAAARRGDVRHSQASIDAIASALGYAPRVDFASGLAQTVEYYRRLHGERAR